MHGSGGLHAEDQAERRRHRRDLRALEMTMSSPETLRMYAFIFEMQRRYFRSDRLHAALPIERAAAQGLRLLADEVERDREIDWYALSNGLGAVMPDGTVIEPEEH